MRSVLVVAPRCYSLSPQDIAWLNQVFPDAYRVVVVGRGRVGDHGIAWAESTNPPRLQIFPVAPPLPLKSWRNQLRRLVSEADVIAVVEDGSGLKTLVRLAEACGKEVVFQ